MSVVKKVRSVSHRVALANPKANTRKQLAGVIKSLRKKRPYAKGSKKLGGTFQDYRVR